MNALVFTVVTRNRLHQARVLMKSVMTSCPDAERHVLVIDPADGLFDPTSETFTLTFGRDLALPRFKEFAFVNDALSLCCLLKPAFALHLLQHTTADVLLYLDSDMCFHNRPAHLFAVLREAPVVLTPHALAPLGRMAGRTDGDLMRSGAFNAGFFALRRTEEAKAFLTWWHFVMSNERQLDATFCHDQQWLSLAAVYFPWIVVLRDPGYNLAYWNISQRPLERAATGGLTACGAPLVIFHYSFFNPTTPEYLVNRPPLVIPAGCAIVRELLRDYAAEIAAAGAARCLSWTYAYDTFTDGKPINQVHRDFYHERVWDDPHHEGDPFDPEFTTSSYCGLKSVYRYNDQLVRAIRRIRHMSCRPK